MKAKILWIEGKRADSPSFVPILRKKGYLIESVPTGNEAVLRLPEMKPDLVVVNAASLRSNGKRICQTLRGLKPDIPILVICDPERTVSDNLASVVLVLPFTSRKLVNRLVRLLPGERNNILRAGPIYLDVERHQVECDGRESKLTPRLVRLLKMLMLHPGEVQERKNLFRELWDTDYTLDMRTLDVHISWLRHAIEADPRTPIYLKTVRGVGYRLDV